MVTHMKTTIEISDALLKAAKRAARARGLTLKALVEDGLRRVLREDQSAKEFRLRRETFGPRDGEEGASGDPGDWETVRRLIYPGRGE
jgi:Arc/MetJ family transcription regulator